MYLGGTGVPEEDRSNASTMMVPGVAGRQVSTFVGVPDSKAPAAHAAGNG